jgi:hypothetical protein
MKKITLIAALLPVFAFHCSSLKAQAVVSDGFNRLQVTYKTALPDVQTVDCDSNYSLITLPGYTSGGQYGSPALPVRSDIIEVPFCEGIVVTVENAVYDTVRLSQHAVPYPLQPSRSKSDTVKDQRLVFDGKVYESDAFFSLPLAEVKVMGVARDRRLAQLCYSPVQVNPVTGQVVVCRSADVTVTYVGADADRTLGHYRRYHTPAFSVGTTLNNLYSDNSALKQWDNAPVRMVMAVPDVLRCGALERFAKWKRMQGFMVDVLYYQDMGITTNTALAEYLKSLYDGATAEIPAPTYLLLVGDHNQLRAFDSQLPDAGYWSAEPGNDHITDLYFVTWTDGDNLPDCYQGRFSATDTATLGSIVDKTLLYEQYAFSNDDYLARAALVAGEDDATHTSYDYAWVYADPNMDYAAYYYVNAAHGYDEVFYYKNDTSRAPSGVTVTGYCSAASTASDLRSLYNSGIGWINYSAHGDWNKWTKPSFTVNHVSAMSNNGMPSFMIGNCCLSSKFDKATCFAESLLRKGNNAGAVAYIGGTNSTYWVEDFFWSVGLRTSVTHNMTPSYNASKLGVYDRLFHTHSESIEKQVFTAGAMIYYGNLSVEASTVSSDNKKKYYWEIYELMGDPSLMPWLGRADDLNVAAVSDGITLSVTTEPYAYVALVDTSTLQLFYAGYADGNGHIDIDLSGVSDVNATMLSVNVQNHKPYTRYFARNPLAVGMALDARLSVYPNPAADRVTIDGLSQGSSVEIYDAQGRQLSSFRIQDPKMQIDVSQYARGLYLLRINESDGVVVRKFIKK